MHETANYIKSEVWVERIMATFWSPGKVYGQRIVKDFEHAIYIPWIAIQDINFITVSLNAEKDTMQLSILGI